MSLFDNLKERLTTKVGPLPAYAWVGAGAVAFVLISKRNASRNAAGDSTMPFVDPSGAGGTAGAPGTDLISQPATFGAAGESPADPSITFFSPLVTAIAPTDSTGAASTSPAPTTQSPSVTAPSFIERVRTTFSSLVPGLAATGVAPNDTGAEFVGSRPDGLGGYLGIYKNPATGAIETKPVTFNAPTPVSVLPDASGRLVEAPTNPLVAAATDTITRSSELVKGLDVTTISPDSLFSEFLGTRPDTGGGYLAIYRNPGTGQTQTRPADFTAIVPHLSGGAPGGIDSHDLIISPTRVGGSEAMPSFNSNQGLIITEIINGQTVHVNQDTGQRV